MMRKMMLALLIAMASAFGKVPAKNQARTAQLIPHSPHSTAQEAHAARIDLLAMITCACACDGCARSGHMKNEQAILSCTAPAAPTKHGQPRTAPHWNDC